MAVVISPEEKDFFSSTSTLQRSHSQSSFATKRSGNYNTTSSTSRLDDIIRDSYQQPVHIVPGSNPSSAPSSPQAYHADSMDSSYSSTPATTLSFDGQYENDVHGQSVHHVELSRLEKPFFAPLESDLEPPASPPTDNSYTPTDAQSSASTSRPGSPTFSEHAEDDTAVKHHPTQHVDYLSHNWREEDIWSSWRYIINKRIEYGNSARLENASWRTWMKVKYNLKTVSPETLNWLKDCDVTWLYGPLQTSHCKAFAHGTGQGSSTLSRCDSFINKKPILKKRSMSEVMLQRSLSQSSLLKQATAAIQAQQKFGHAALQNYCDLPKITADFVTSPSAPRGSGQNSSLHPSTSTSGMTSPSAERKHIHFDEQVQQCIAVDVKGEEEDEDDIRRQVWNFGDDSDSDDGAIMMKTTKPKRPPVPRKKTPTFQNGEGKTIAMLPSTTLKYRTDSPEPIETAMKHSGNFFASPSSSQETLRASGLSDTSFPDDYDERTVVDDEGNSSTPMSSPVEGSSIFQRPNVQRSSSYNGSYTASSPAGMRRTDSGMFMPYEDGEEVQPNDGIIGKVIDTVNTARDIAHVIWNVGWRR